MEFLRKMVMWAVVAVAVGGGWGVGWAAGADSPLSGSLTNIASTKNTVTASYEVKMVGSMEATDGKLSGAALLNYNAESGTATGNAGTVLVKTNYPNWDITFTTSNGGKLRAPGATAWETGDALQYKNSDGTPDPVVLGMQIGIIKGAVTTGGGGQPLARSNVQKSWITASDKTPVSFAAVLGNEKNDDNVSNSLSSDLGGRKLYSATATDETVNNNGFAAPPDIGILFFINLGLSTGETGVEPKKTIPNISGNKNNVYSEKITLSMSASY